MIVGCFVNIDITFQKTTLVTKPPMLIQSFKKLEFFFYCILQLRAVGFKSCADASKYAGSCRW